MFLNYLQIIFFHILFFIFIPSYILKNIKYYYLIKIVYFSFVFYVIIFTLLPVSFLKKGILINFNFYYLQSKFSFNLSWHNFIINFILSHPLAVLLFFKQRKNPQNQSSYCFMGFIFGFVIEFYQFLLPTNRVVDIADIFFIVISVFTIFNFYKILYPTNKPYLYISSKSCCFS